MSNPIAQSILKLLLQAWKDGNPFIRLMMVISGILLVAGGCVAALAAAEVLDRVKTEPVGATLAAVGGVLFLTIAAYQAAVEESARERKIEQVEQRVEQNPEETQAAWELARVKLESYMNRNLNQVRAIFWLTVLVMLVGFGLIGFGVARVYESPENFKASIVVAVSGVLVNFIGGSFLIIYRSVMSQASEYVTVLERINAVGMSLQILDSLKDSNPDLQQKTTADVVLQMLRMYSPAESKSPKPKTG